MTWRAPCDVSTQAAESPETDLYKYAKITPIFCDLSP